MSERVVEYNQVSLTGRIVSEFMYDHTIFGEDFYIVNVLVGRLSNVADLIPVTVSERMVDVHSERKGELVGVHGQFRSFNRWDKKKTRLILTVFAKEFHILSAHDQQDMDDSLNEIFLDGYICKPPIYRRTPRGREIADIMMAVNRSYGKADYIPCICWGRTARFVSGFEVGEHVVIWGRVQSREYLKKQDDSQTLKRIAYEVSISRLEHGE